ncbi:MAG: DUF3703 domain-containing protein [Rhodospirillaceae bacterium]
MAYIMGAAIAVGVALFGTWARFDRSRAFYPTALIVVASYYVLFAAIAGAASVFAPETFLFVLFAGLAAVGFRRSLWLVAAGLIAHGLQDMVHDDLISNPGVPVWWPGFCMAFDVVAGIYLSLLLLYRDARDERFAAGIAPFVADELHLAASADRAGDAARSFHHLERAHVLSQAATGLHVRVHLRMLAWGIRYRRPREVMGQALRVVGAALLTRFSAVPQGNTGGANVSAFQPMPIAPDLAGIIARTESVTR